MAPEPNNGETREKVAVHGSEIASIQRALARLETRLEQVDAKLDSRVPDCVAHAERLRVVEKDVEVLKSTVHWRTWESRATSGLANLVAVIAAALARQ